MVHAGRGRGQPSQDVDKRMHDVFVLEPATVFSLCAAALELPIGSRYFVLIWTLICLTVLAVGAYGLPDNSNAAPTCRGGTDGMED